MGEGRDGGVDGRHTTPKRGFPSRVEWKVDERGQRGKALAMVDDREQAALSPSATIGGGACVSGGSGPAHARPGCLEITRREQGEVIGEVERRS